MMNGNYSLQDLLNIPLKHTKKVVCVTIAVMVLTILALIISPRIYMSEAKLFIRMGRESVTLDATTQVGQNIMLAESRETELNSVLEVLRSRAIAQLVVERVGAQIILDPTIEEGEEPRLGIKDLLIGVARKLLGNDPEPGADEKAIVKFQRSMNAEMSKKRSNVVTLHYQSKTPHAAQTVLAAIVDVYNKEHVRINQAEGSLDFFVEQTEHLKSEWELAKLSLRDEKNSRGIASIAGERDAIESQLKDVRTSNSQLAGMLAGARAKQRDLAKLLRATPTRILAESETGHDNAAADEMRALLFELELREKELLSKYKPTHPAVRVVRSQVEAAKSVLKTENSERTRNTENRNPAFQTIQTALLQQYAETNGLTAQLEAGLKTEKQLVRDIRQLNHDELTIADLEQQVKLLEVSYGKAYSAFEQSRVSDALEEKRISNVAVVQPPSFQLKPIAPKKLEIILLGGFMAVFAGVGTAFVCEQLGQSNRRLPPGFDGGESDSPDSPNNDSQIDGSLASA